MNMILHDCPTAEIWQDNTLPSPHFKDARRRAQDVRLRGRESAVLDQGVEQRLRSGQGRVRPLRASASRRRRTATTPSCCTSWRRSRAPAKARSSCRTACCSEAAPRATIRREIVRRGYIKGIIGLPANLFYGTGIPACIVVLDKASAAARKGIFMIDASKGFMKDGNKNRLRAQDIHKIVDAFTRQSKIPRYSRMVPLAEISDARTTSTSTCRATSTAPSRRTSRTSTRHLHGGIPDRDLDALERYWEVFPGVRATLFTRPAGRATPAEGAAERGQERKRFSNIRSSRRSRPGSLCCSRAGAVRPGRSSKASSPGDHPKALIEGLSEFLGCLRRRAAARPLRRLPASDGLLGRDDAGRRLPGRRVGWVAAARPRLIVETKGQASREEPDSG